MRNAGKLVGQRQLLQQVWGPEYGSETNYLRVHMAHIRRKLEPDPSRSRGTSSPSRAWATASKRPSTPGLGGLTCFTAATPATMCVPMSRISLLVIVT